MQGIAKGNIPAGIGRASYVPSRKRIGWPGWAMTGAVVPTWKEDVSWPMTGLVLTNAAALWAGAMVWRPPMLAGETYCMPGCGAYETGAAGVLLVLPMRTSRGAAESLARLVLIGRSTGCCDD